MRRVHSADPRSGPTPFTRATFPRRHSAASHCCCWTPHGPGDGVTEGCSALQHLLRPEPDRRIDHLARDLADPAVRADDAARPGDVIRRRGEALADERHLAGVDA